MQNILTNSIGADTILINKTNNNPINNTNENKYFGFENCCIIAFDVYASQSRAMGLLFEKETKNFTIVIPSNNLHLIKLINNSPESYPLYLKNK